MTVQAAGDDGRLGADLPTTSRPPPLRVLTMPSARHKKHASKSVTKGIVVRCTAVSPDGRHVVCGCDDGSLYLWAV